MQEISSVNIYFIWLLGKGESIWDRFVHRHGNIPKEANGDVASDSYHKYPEDIKCIEHLGGCSFFSQSNFPVYIPKTIHQYL